MKYPAVLSSLAALTPATLLAIAQISGDDGHSLYNPVAYTQAGLPMELTNYFTRSHTSDGTPTGTIFKNGAIVQQLEAIYGLSVLEHIANALEIELPNLTGRGFRARALFTLIQHHLQKQIQPATPAAAT